MYLRQVGKACKAETMLLYFLQVPCSCFWWLNHGPLISLYALYTFNFIGSWYCYPLLHQLQFFRLQTWQILWIYHFERCFSLHSSLAYSFLQLFAYYAAPFKIVLFPGLILFLLLSDYHSTFSTEISFWNWWLTL